MSLFEQQLAAFNHSSEQEAVWRVNRKNDMAALRTSVVRAVLQYRSTFGGLIEDARLPVVPGLNDPMVSFDIDYDPDGDCAVAVFNHWSLGRDGAYRIELPLPYLQSGGEDLMKDGADTLRTSMALAASMTTPQVVL